MILGGARQGQAPFLHVEIGLVSIWFVLVLPFRVIRGIAASDSEH